MSNGTVLGPVDVEVWITDATTVTEGDSLIEISEEVIGFGGYTLDEIAEQANGYGQAYVWEELVGVRRIPDMQLSVMVKTGGTNTGYSVLKGAGKKRTLKVVIGAETMTVDVNIKQRAYGVDRGAIDKYNVTVGLAGVPTFA